MLTSLDLRGVLNYVEQFNKKNFLFILEESCLEEAWLSGFLLDVDKLIGVGVGCLVCLNSHDEAILEKVEELLLESSVAFDFFQEVGSSKAQWEAALTRGQILVTKGLIEDKTQVQKIFTKLIWIDESGFAQLADSQLNTQLLDRRAIFLDQSEPINLENQDERLMVAKDWCAQARIPRVHFLTTAEEHSLLEELFSAEGVGVMVYTNPYEEIRPLEKSEIVELLALMGPVISRQALLPRSYAEIENQIEDYLALVVDQHVLGCVAIHYHSCGENKEDQLAEIACLFIKPTHQNQGYAKKLVKAAEAQAISKGAHQLVALTKTAGKLFIELGYTLENQDLLPDMIKDRGAPDKEFYVKSIYIAE